MKAISFAIDTKPHVFNDNSKTPVLLEIEFTGKNQYFFLDSDEVSAYSYEKEVLLQDGIQYTVKSVSTETMNIKLVISTNISKPLRLFFFTILYVYN